MENIDTKKIKKVIEKKIQNYDDKMEMVGQLRTIGDRLEIIDNFISMTIGNNTTILIDTKNKKIKSIEYYNEKTKKFNNISF